MITLAVNNFIWNEMKQVPQIYDRYVGFREKYGDNFIPFFPIDDTQVGDISWGSAPYIIWDSMPELPTRPVYGEKREQIMYTLIGKIPEIFSIRDFIVNLFNYWESNSFSSDGYRVNDLNVYQSDRTRGRDNIRQTYSLTLIVEAYYHKC